MNENQFQNNENVNNNINSENINLNTASNSTQVPPIVPIAEVQVEMDSNTSLEDKSLNQQSEMTDLPSGDKMMQTPNEPPKNSKLSTILLVLLFVFLFSYIMGMPYINNFINDLKEDHNLSKIEQEAIEEEKRQEAENNNSTTKPVVTPSPSVTPTPSAKPEEETGQEENNNPTPQPTTTPTPSPSIAPTPSVTPEVGKNNSLVCKANLLNTDTYTSTISQKFYYNSNNEVLNTDTIFSYNFMVQDDTYTMLKNQCDQYSSEFANHNSFKVECNYNGSNIEMTQKINLETFTPVTSSDGTTINVDLTYKQDITGIKNTLISQGYICE